MRKSLGHIVADEWERALEELEDPFHHPWFLRHIIGLPPRSYREELDRERINSYGRIIPRIVTVRRNLRRLGSIRLDPARLR